MPHEDIQFLQNKFLMQPDEIFEIAKIFVGLGVTKIRLTGGEPLARKEFSEIARKLSSLPIHLTLTSNGALVHKQIDLFKEINLKSINISLDTLDRKKFIQLTKRDAFEQVWQNILLLIENDFSVKLNVVAMKGVNDDEVLDFISLTKIYPIHIRFIEFMPFDKNDWSKEKVVHYKDLLNTISEHEEIIKLPDLIHDTAKKYKVIQSKGSFAFITTMSQPFCGDCNRMRLTADGKMKNCLFGKDELDLLSAFRKGEDIVPIIKKSLFLKFEKMGGQFEENYMDTDVSKIVNRSMIKIGG
jgi:cyclic pyranopterin phosphate synthase